MGEEMLTMEECLQMAAQAWCQPETSNTVMDPLLAVAFAQILYDFANRTIDAPECGHLWRTTVTGRCTICGVEVPEEEWDPQRREPTPSPAAPRCAWCSGTGRQFTGTAAERPCPACAAKEGK